MPSGCAYLVVAVEFWTSRAHFNNPQSGGGGGVGSVVV